eukprot:TRINITY_DN30673_c0_g1_i1.p1 TRINITY_DN30673_c0_g1~~TRINITY_DN30673_c0_g1_i1.p1  ORF type:complete len:651 (+),score=105.23 TRINITY_DN30673_c0_g1_i1:216-1955(+)
MADGPGDSNAGVKHEKTRRWNRKDVATAAVKQDGSSNDCRVVLWLRNELRLADNPLIVHALRLCERNQASLLPVFCLDPCDFGIGAYTKFGSLKVGQIRRTFLEETLSTLGSDLRLRRSDLSVCDAPPEAVLAAAVGAGDIVLATREACPEEVAAEVRVRRALETQGAKLELLDTAGITTIFGAAELQAARLAEGEGFPEDFKVFYNAVRSKLGNVCQQGLSDSPDQMPPLAVPLSALPGLRNGSCSGAAATASKGKGKGKKDSNLDFCGGEYEGLKRMQSWLQMGGHKRYKATFRHLLGDYSSRLSPHLVLGCISPRRLCTEMMAVDTGGPHVEHFLYEMCWRDFFRHAARRWGSSLFQVSGPVGPVTEASRSNSWKRDVELEGRWKSGKTGVPLVDAAMRELDKTGYMGNLARQFAAAYLVEDLGIDWRVGADWFESKLVDYDPHSNWGQWARSASVAPTNEAKKRRVGGTRYFDLALDIGGREAQQYVRTWVKELASLPDNEVLSPWNSRTPIDAYPRAPFCSEELRRYFETAPSRKGGGKGSKGTKAKSGSQPSGYSKGGKAEGKGSARKGAPGK